VFPRIVEQHCLQAMQIPLRAGRYFDDRDNATGPKSVIINANLARALWPPGACVRRDPRESNHRAAGGVESAIEGIDAASARVGPMRGCHKRDLGSPSAKPSR
jgi:hypothetical protein